MLTKEDIEKVRQMPEKDQFNFWCKTLTTGNDKKQLKRRNEKWV